MYTNRGFNIKKPELITTQFPDAPADTISDIAFNTDNTAMAVSSWDSTLTIYRINYSIPFKETPFPFQRDKVLPLSAPGLSVCFFGSNIVVGCVDGSIIFFDMNGTQSTIQAHSGGVKAVKNFNNQYLISGSFDKTLKFWDLKSPQPIHTAPLSSKVYGMSLSGSILGVALSDKTIQVYDMMNPTVPVAYATRFTYSIRAVGVCSDMDAFAVGSVEAKIEILSRSSDSKKCLIRAHREQSKLYAVNVIQFHPSDPNIIISGGSDGTLVWFDRSNRMKLGSHALGSPVTAGAFSNDGRYFICATGEDWSKGYTATYVQPGLHMIEVRNVAGLNK